MTADNNSFEAGWYPDPKGDHEYRYYDGSQWSEHVSDKGSLSDDPISSPAPPLDEGGQFAGSTKAATEPWPAAADASGSTRRKWLLGLAAGAVVAAVVVVLILALGGGGGASEPRLGTYAGGADDVTISVVVAGDPAAVPVLDIETRCGGLSLSQTLEFASPRPIEDGSFEVFVPGVGELELDGTFVDGGDRVRGDVRTGSCSWEWEADFVGGESVPGPGDGAETDAEGRPVANAVRWEAPDATLTAENFYVEANGLLFAADVDEIEVGGNPLSGGIYTTIEVEWIEHDTEMRFFLYLDSFGDPVDGRGDTWGSDEFRVYDGTLDPDWVYFEERIFEVPIGEAYRVDVFEFVGEDGVVVHFDGLTIESNLRSRDDDVADDGDEATVVEAEPAVGPPIAVGDRVDVGDLTVELVDASYQCFEAEGVGALCPADLSATDEPLTIELALIEGDVAEFEALGIELVDREGRTYAVLSEVARAAGDETSARFLTFGLPEITDELEITIGGGDRFDLEGGITDEATDDGGEPARAFVRDDFDGSLGEGWEWFNEDPTGWSLEEVPGRLSIVARDVGPNGTQNMLARPIPERLDPEAFFLVTTQVAFEPVSNFQVAGLMIAGADPDVDRVQLGRAYCDAEVCALGGVYFDRLEGGGFVGDNFAIPFENTPELFIQLAVQESPPGDWLVLGAYSFDGEDWNLVGEHFIDFEPEFVGLIAGQAPDELTASFEFFEFEELPSS